MTAQQADEINRRNALRCPHHVRRMPSCPICCRVSEELTAPLEAVFQAAKGKRIRQSDKPLMNKLEAEWFAIINAQFPNYPRPRAQTVTIRLANGVRYTPDMFAFSWPSDRGSCPTAWEVKGKHAWDDAIVKLKVAATSFPEIRFVLVWKNGGEWRQQEVMT